MQRDENGLGISRLARAIDDAKGEMKPTRNTQNNNYQQPSTQITEGKKWEYNKHNRGFSLTRRNCEREKEEAKFLSRMVIDGGVGRRESFDKEQEACEITPALDIEYSCKMELACTLLFLSLSPFRSPSLSHVRPSSLFLTFAKLAASARNPKVARYSIPLACLLGIVGEMGYVPPGIRARQFYRQKILSVPDKRNFDY